MPQGGSTFSLLSSHSTGIPKASFSCGKGAYPSVSIMMRELRENGFIEIDFANDISLTEKGMQIAVSIAERHEILSKVLMMLGVPEETAYNDACKIEHDLSPVSFEKIKEYYLIHK